jgi:hypothetical protein
VNTQTRRYRRPVRRTDRRRYIAASRRVRPASPFALASAPTPSSPCPHCPCSSADGTPVDETEDGGSVPPRGMAAALPSVPSFAGAPESEIRSWL